MSAGERISVDNETIYASHANHIQRYMFAEQYCLGKKVLDAGCGTGYGSAHLAFNAAQSVVAVDISDKAVEEAKRLYRRDNLRFIKGNVERLTEIAGVDGPFDLVINFENIEHLANPTHLLAEVKKVLTNDGTFLVSTPNGLLTDRDEAGNIKNQFHLKEFTQDELREMLGQFFGSVEFFGQWKTPERLARQDFEMRLFATLNEIYYNPFNRLWRSLRKLSGRTSPPPPMYTGEWTCFAREFTIRPIESSPFPWPPDVLIAVCRP